MQIRRGAAVDKREAAGARAHLIRRGAKMRVTAGKPLTRRSLFPGKWLNTSQLYAVYAVISAANSSHALLCSSPGIASFNLLGGFRVAPKHSEALHLNLKHLHTVHPRRGAGFAARVDGCHGGDHHRANQDVYHTRPAALLTTEPLYKITCYTCIRCHNVLTSS